MTKQHHHARAHETSPHALVEPTIPVNLLIVEDDAALLNVLINVLRRDIRYVFHPAITGERACEIIAQGRTDVVILDLSLPGIKDIDVLCHARDAFCFFECIVISGYAEKIQEVKSAFNPSTCFLKPFTLQAFRDAVDTAAENVRALRISLGHV